MGMLDEKFHRDIVDNDCADNGEKIAEHLAPAIYMGGAKGDISVKPEAGKECYREDDSKREDMWRDYYKAQIDELLGYNEIIDNKVPNSIERHIESTTSPVAEDLLWNKPPHYGDVK